MVSICFTPTSHHVLVLVLLLLCLNSRSCYGFGQLSFDIHQLYSDPVKGILGVDELPEKGSVPYYMAMAHRDRLIRGRHLASSDDQTALLTFNYGNDTYRLDSFGYLHYVNVSVGTPSSSYLVALDTGSDLFWLPCDCTSCIHGIKFPDGQILDFSIYSPNTSSTSKKVLCSSTMCQQQRRCTSDSSNCPYQVQYLSNGTSSTGFLVEDVLHLVTEDAKSKYTDARITFGCGKVQTGSFLDGAAPNGLFGLGISNISVPSILAKEGIVSNSFSMCFGADGTGRIQFGDNGSLNQGETPFNLRHLHPTYNVSITQIIVGGTAADLEFYAIFDSGTSFTYLNDPAYTKISESFNSLAKERRHSSNADIPFEYCYDLKTNQTELGNPSMNLTMKGGHSYYVHDPIVMVPVEGGLVYCLGVVKSGDVNIIGQNFMTGYRVLFDREKMVLGWKQSNCYDDEETTTLPINPSKAPTVAPTINVNPEATAENSNNSPIPSAAPPPNNGHSSKLKTCICLLIMIIFSFFVIV